MSDSKDTPILTKSSTLDFGTSTAMPPASEQSTRKKSSKPTKTDVFIKTMEENKQQNKEIADSLNKLGDFLKSNSQQLDKVAENLDSNTKAMKKQVSDSEDEEKRNKDNKKKSKNKDGDDLSSLSGEDLIKKISGDPLYSNVDKASSSLASGISPLLGIAAQGLGAMGINTKNIGKEIQDIITGKFKKSSKNKSGKTVSEIDEDNDTVSAISPDSQETQTPKKKTKKTKALDAPISQSESAKAKEKNDAESEAKLAKELATSRHKETIKELKSIDKSVKEIDVSKKGVLETITTALGAGGVALLAGFLFNKNFRDMVIGNIKEWFNSPLGSIKNAWAEFIFKLESKMISFSTKFVSRMAGMVTGAAKGMAETGSKLGSAVKSIITTVTSKVKSSVALVTNSVKGVANLIKSSAKSVFGIVEKSFSKLGVVGSAVGKSIQWAGKGASWIGKGLSVVSKVFKGLLKAIPFVGTIMSLISAYRRFKQGDYKGAMIDIASAVAAAFPGVGTAASVALDGWNLKRDLSGDSEKESEKSGKRVVREDDIRPTEDYLKEAGVSTSRTKEITNEEIQKAVKSDDVGSLGVLSNKYEGKVGTVSSGRGDAGGVSFGKYQFASANSGLSTFMGSLKENHPELYSKLMANDASYSGGRTNKQFQDNWRKVAKEDTSEFEKAQDEAAKELWYDPKAKAFQEITGIDPNSNKAIANAVWSSSIQHGDKDNLIFKNAGITKGMDTEEVIQRLYNSRANYVSGLNIQNKRSLYNRYQNEAKDAIKIARAEKSSRPYVVSDTVLASVQSDKVTPVTPVQNTDDIKYTSMPKKTVTASAMSPGTLDTSKNTKTANNLVNEKIQTDIAESMGSNQTQIASAQGSMSSTSLTINNSNFIPINTSAYIGLHQA